MIDFTNATRLTVSLKIMEIVQQINGLLKDPANSEKVNELNSDLTEYIEYFDAHYDPDFIADCAHKLVSNLV